jgi:hypothetical protein
LNIDDFKESMDTSSSEIDIPQAELENYKKSLYYYRRYKDRDDKIHIEGQIRCNNDPGSPFHCIITDQVNTNIDYYLANSTGESCNDVCEHAATATEIPGATGTCKPQYNTFEEGELRGIMNRLLEAKGLGPCYGTTDNDIHMNLGPSDLNIAPFYFALSMSGGGGVRYYCRAPPKTGAGALNTCGSTEGSSPATQNTLRLCKCQIDINP